MLRAILNKSWRQHPTRHQLYGHLPPITKTIQVRRTRHAGHCWRSKDELVSDVLLWTPTYDQAKAGQPARIYIQQLCEDTGCNPEDLPEAMNVREKWREMVRNIRAGGTTWWWWWWYLCMYICTCIYMYLYIYVYICIYMRVYINVYLYIFRAFEIWKINHSTGSQEWGKIYRPQIFLFDRLHFQSIIVSNFIIPDIIPDCYFNLINRLWSEYPG